MFDPFKKEENKILKVKIEELEEENTKLSLKLEKREEKTRKALSAKQEVDMDLNEARKRISTLENECEKLKKETKSEFGFRFSVNLSRKRFEEILFLLDSMHSKKSTLTTIYLAKDGILEDIPANVTDLLEGSSLSLIEKIDSSTGKVVFFDTDQIIRLAILPVFPILNSEYSVARRFNIEPLKNCLQAEKILIINAHGGETFIGIVESDSFIEHEIIRSSVMGKHSKGGWSQKRFQNLIIEDIKHHGEKVRDALHPMIEKNKDIQYVIAAGEGKLIKMILEGHEYPLLSKSMDVTALNPQQVLKEVMSVRLYGF